MSTMSIRGSVVQVYLEVDGEQYDISHVTSSAIGPLLGDGDQSQVVPTFVCALTAGAAISTLEQKFQITKDQRDSFLKYPSAKIIAVVTSVGSTDATPFLADGTYTLIDGDIVEAGYSKSWLSISSANVYYVIRIAHKLRRLAFGDLTAFPIYGWDLYLPRNYAQPGDASANDTLYGIVYNALVTKLVNGKGTRIFEDFIKPLIQVRLNPEAAVKAGSVNDNDVSAANATRGTQFPTIVAAALAALSKSNVGSITGMSKEKLQLYASSVLELITSNISVDSSKVSENNKRQLQEFLVTTMQGHLLSSDMESLGLIAGLIAHPRAWLVPNSIGGIIMPIPGIAPVASRKIIPLADYSSAVITASSKGVDDFVGGYIGFRVAPESTAYHQTVESSAVISVINAPLGRGGMMRKVNLPSWMSLRPSNSEETTLTEKDKANLVQQAGASNTVSLSASLGDINKLATNYINYEAVRRQLSHLVIDVKGPFRLDIGPGQPVEIEMPSGDFSEETHWYCGYVISIQFGINAESGEIYTQYTLNGVAEKSIYDQYLDVGKHPFVVENEQSYSTTWSAAQNAT